MNQNMKKWKETLNNGKNLILELRKDSTKQAYYDLKKYVIRLLKKIIPKKLKGEVTFGFEDPAITGQVLGGVAFFLPIYKDTVKIIPDFENQVLIAEGQGKGKIRLFHVVYAILSVLLNKNIMRTYHRLRKQSGGNRNE